MLAHIESLVNEHGEVHASLSEHDSEFEFRQGTTTFHPQKGYVRVEEHSTVHLVNADEIVRVYTPNEALH